ncbi:hypothetical protein [Mesorhizobium sp. B2-1-3A]|uniref:hypothetical protein n=1 Tax=Mesorhizobium sp. B2-1-3A TaxID=2589971 RepID=UPI001126D36D|nr:hypothetical protein [Mesorhizobium sp. B2-1-3A]TPM94688.1 hypothetical protein FJ977_21590 [Mesorhizobium sp. B2-1-3A]
MKISKAVRDAYAHNEERYLRLQDEVTLTLKSRVEESHWFFLGRVKKLESFALKIETGRVDDITAPDDFFGCTIVVPNALALPAAEALVLEHYDFKKRRPSSDTETHKPPHSFVFDDIRMYVTRRDTISGRNGDLTGLPFEVQIKTILQHAWTIATHDLVYKSDAVSWSKERIAFQVKAMLEHAEIAIAEAPNLAASRSVAKQDASTVQLEEVITQVVAFWQADQLPKDVKRLATSVVDLLNTCDLKADSLTAILAAERDRLGSIALNLSPYAFTLQALANSGTAAFEEKFKRRHVRTKVVIHADMEVPQWMKDGHARIRVL